MGWITYSKSSQDRFGVLSAEYTVMAQPRCPVDREIGGLLTLGAIRAPELERAGEEIYRATRVRQTAIGPETVIGYIVRDQSLRYDQWAHGRSLGAARGTLSKRGASQSSRNRQSAVYKALRARDFNGYDVPVRISDSLRAGNCRDGTLAFRDRHFPGRDTALVSEILAVPAGSLSELVLAACVVAIHRQA